MRLSAVIAAGLAACVGLSACGDSGADDSLRQATDKTRSAPYLVVSQPGGRELFLSRTLTVIRRHGRATAWTAETHEFTWRATKRCYERSTAFNRDDVRQLRDAVAPQGLRGLHSEARNGVQVLSGRLGSSTDSADTELEVRLDSSGRITTLRQRSARFGAVPAGHWISVKYRYPTGAQFTRAAGPAPTPRCR